MRRTFFLVVLVFCSLIARNARSFSYTVKEGDTPNQILRQFYPTLAELEKQNPGKLRKLQIGSVLEIPLARMSDYKAALAETDRLKAIIANKDAKIEVLNSVDQAGADLIKKQKEQVQNLEKERDEARTTTEANKWYRDGFMWAMFILVVCLVCIVFLKQDGDQSKRQNKVLKDRIHYLEDGANNFRQHNGRFIQTLESIMRLDEGRMNHLCELVEKIFTIPSAVTRETLKQYVKELRAEKDKERSIQRIK